METDLSIQLFDRRRSIRPLPFKWKPGFTYDAHIKPVFIIQESGTGYSLWKSVCPSAPIFLELQFLKLQDLFEMKLLLLTLVYEPVNKLSLLCFYEFFVCFRNLIIIILGKHAKVITYTQKNFWHTNSTLQYDLRSIGCAGCKSRGSISLVIKQASTAVNSRHQHKLSWFSINNHSQIVKMLPNMLKSKD